ncbi:hypothetical protein C1645_801530 [Glomus cerebriforme]|uniref:Uncharacterized protein n=1 Tax=Glomus cerebriforme TaxID=658196 RepID=A0A397TI89_9GLOM|nr:hypothetical protein C1645_801530 [Glomus cerebriforme]
MTHFEFKYKYAIVFIILILITTSPTYCTFQKGKDSGPIPNPGDPGPKAPLPPPGPCMNCVIKCCTDYTNCINSLINPPDLCDNILKNCNNVCNMGDCKGITYSFNCNTIQTEFPPGPPTSSELPSGKTSINTCSSPNDSACFPPGVVPVTTTFIKEGVETPTPVPNNVKLTTIKTTITSYFAGYSTTNSLGSPTFIPPSTLYVVKNVVVTAVTNSASTLPTFIPDSAANSLDLNSHGLWGVIISLAIIITTLVFMVLI